jgi:hypothetical protein
MSAFEAAPAASSADLATKTESPKDAYFERLDNVSKEQKALGAMMVQGISGDSDDEEDDEDEEGDDSKVYTAEQISQLRHIIINDSREKCLKKAAKFATGGQEGDGFMMFNTQTGNNIIYGIPLEIEKAMKKKKISERFDAMFALTYNLKEYDCWMQDNEMWGEDGELDAAILKLGATWKKLLAKSSLELGIDDDFTRPGIMTILEQFKETAENVESIEVEFDWN